MMMIVIMMVTARVGVAKVKPEDMRNMKAEDLNNGQWITLITRRMGGEYGMAWMMEVLSTDLYSVRDAICKACQCVERFYDGSPRSSIHPDECLDACLDACLGEHMRW